MIDPIDPDHLYALYLERRKERGPLLAQMEELRLAYNGDIVIPMESGGSKSEQTLVANLISTGLDQSSMRVASSMPMVTYPPEKIGDQAMEKQARLKRNATLAWYHENRLKVKMRRRARWLLGYATAPVMLKPDWQRRIPRWQLMEPLSTYPAPSLDQDEMTPPDCIFSYRRSYQWVCQRYPDSAARLGNMSGRMPGREDIIDILEYISDNQRCVVALGTPPEYWDHSSKRGVVRLDWAENETGICWVVIPGRITLDRPQGQYDGMLGLFQVQSRLMNLSVAATERGIYPDTYLVSRPGETAVFISGPHDGRTGRVNIVKGGDIKEVNLNPGYQTNPTIDKLERAMRLTGGVPAEYGGESQTNVRTGRRGDAVLSAVVDFPVQEAQELFEFSLQEENKRAIAIDRTYFDTTKSFYVQWKGADKAKMTYTPSKLFKNDVNFVNFAHAGADINSLIVGLGQRVGLRMMSIQTAQEMDPFIDDAEVEHDRTVTEAIEQSLLASVQTGAQQGTWAPNDLAKIMTYVRSDSMDLAGAITKVHEEAQARQATVDAQGQPTGVDPNSPAAQPGLAQAGMGAEAGASVPAPAQGQRNLSMMLNELRGTRQELRAGANPQGGR
jgi:hypothetical protein